MKKAIVILLGLVALVVVAVMVVPPMMGGTIKGKVVEAVRDATGRDLTIAGDFSVSVFPSISLQMSEISLSNPPGSADPNMMTVSSVDAEIALFPLIGKEVEVTKLVIQDPVLLLNQDAEKGNNWTFEGAEKPAEEEPAEPGEFPLSDIRLGDVRIEGGRVSFKDAASGQDQNVENITLKVALENMASALNLDLSMVLNGEDMTLALAVDSLAQAMQKEAFALDTKLASNLVSASYGGRVVQQPVPGLDGAFELNIDSVGALLAWLQQPLPEGQPDPGPFKALATVKADAGNVILEEATLTGEGLEARATGSVDASGEIMKVVLNVESGVLDIDRYLPPPAAAKTDEVAAEVAGEAAEEAVEEVAPRTPQDAIAGLSDLPFDLEPLKKTEADIKVALGGLKASGVEIGPVAFVATLKGGVLTADLSELSLYGGGVTANVNLDGSGDALGVETLVEINKVNVGALAEAATKGPPPAGGVASGRLEATANGASPKALVESLSGSLAFDLGGLDLADAGAADLSGLRLNVILPGLQARPNVQAQAVYKKQPVSIALDLAPLDQVLSGDPFDLEAKVSSKLVNAGYAGSVQQQPVPGLDGSFNLDVGSVGKLLAWIGQPLPDGQKDPGPLKVAAVFKTDDQKVALESVKIDGQDLSAQASGSFDGSGDVKKVALKIEAGVLDIDRYMPPPPEGAPAPATEDKPSGKPGDVLAGLSDEPIDLSGLKGTEADISVVLGGLKAAGFEIGKMAFATTLKDGVLAADLSELALYGGSITGKVDLDASGDALGVGTDIVIATLDVGALAQAATKGEAPVSGVASGTVKINAKGASPKALARSLTGSLGLDLGGIDVPAEQAADLSGLKVNLELPEGEGRPSLRAEAVYKQEPVTVSLDLDRMEKVLSGETFALTAKITSALVAAGYDGTVQQAPTPGLDGSFDLDVASVGNLMAWVGQPLAEGQPDPGPLKVAAVLSADEGKAALKEASIEGKAMKATASGSFEKAADSTSFLANLNIQELDLNAYLPPSKKAEEEETQPSTPSDGGQAQEGWSEEPFDLAGLRALNGKVDIVTGPIKYLDLTIDGGQANLVVENGVATVKVTDLNLAGGTIGADIKLDGSGDAADLTYQASIAGIAAKPFLATFAGVDWLSGTANFEAKGTGQGRNQKELVGTLNGDGMIQFLNGAIEGINLAETIRSAKTLGVGESAEGGEVPKTDFTELGGTYTITNGLLNNPDFKMLAPLVRVSGAGDVMMPPKTVDYGVEAKLVASLEGQGGDDALAGLPIPIRLTGPWSKVDYEIDWETVFMQAAADPERLKNMPAELQDAAKGLGVDLPIPTDLPGSEVLEGVTGDGGVGKVLEGVTGGGEEGGAGAALQEGLGALIPGGESSGGEAAGEEGGGALAPLENLLGGQKSEDAAPAEDGTAESAAESVAPAPAEAAPTEAAPAEEAPAAEEAVEEPLNKLKNLFGD